MAILTVYAYTDTNMQTALGNFNPSTLTWGLQDISSADTGRTQTGKMIINRVAQKVKLSVSWQGVPFTSNGTDDNAQKILSTFNPSSADNPYIRVKYPDPQSGAVVGKVFYMGDRSSPFYMYTNGKKIMQDVSFDLIEV